jgi:hypothetical protein
VIVSSGADASVSYGEVLEGVDSIRIELELLHGPPGGRPEFEERRGAGRGPPRHFKIEGALVHGTVLLGHEPKIGSHDSKRGTKRGVSVLGNFPLDTNRVAEPDRVAVVRVEPAKVASGGVSADRVRGVERE